MAWFLKSYQYGPPGNYTFVERQGIIHEFPANPTIEALAKDVSDFRIANHLSRTSLAECLEDVDAFNCWRIRNDPMFCVDSTESFASRHSQHPWFKQSCATCGQPVPVM